jgi:hypothetical protein
MINYRGKRSFRRYLKREAGEQFLRGLCEKKPSSTRIDWALSDHHYENSNQQNILPRKGEYL